MKTKTWFMDSIGRMFGFHLPARSNTTRKKTPLVNYKPDIAEACGLLGIMLYLLLYNFNLAPDWLIQLQDNPIYKQATGFMLFAIVASQWQLAATKNISSSVKKSRRKQHKLIGGLSPLLFYLHSVETGFAYQVLLAWVFLANVLVGSINPEVCRLRIRGYYTSWLLVHISLSIVIICLAFFHLYVTYWY